MTATSGFYVRSLAHDLGEKLESAGLMTELVRNRQGDFVLGGPNCLEYSDLAKGEDVWGPQVEGMVHRWNQPGGVNGGESEAQEKVKFEEQAAESPRSKREGTPERAGSPQEE
jgi:tRNA pseudouridine55 synthase